MSRSGYSGSNIGNISIVRSIQGIGLGAGLSRMPDLRLGQRMRHRLHRRRP